jgi:GT2 family glycosyltransferase
MKPTMKNPLVSICIPAYNAAAYIGDTLRSVLAQTYQNLEIIVCDDCSVDNTIEIAKSFTDKRIAVYKNEQNLGNTINYNRVLGYANGKYIKLLCADDLIAPECIARQVAIFEENTDNDIALVACHRHIIDAAGKRLFTKKCCIRGYMNGKQAVRMSILHGTNIFGEPGVALLRRDILAKTAGLIVPYCNDFELWCKMLLHGAVFVVDESLFSFRIIPTSVSAKTALGQAKIMKEYFTTLYKNSNYGIARSTLVVGKILAVILCIVRNAVFRFANKT